MKLKLVAHPQQTNTPEFRSWFGNSNDVCLDTLGMRLRLRAHVTTGLELELQKLSKAFTEAAQQVYDEWDASDPEMGDFQVGFGGICHLIVDAWMNIVNNSIPNVSCSPFCHSDEQHVSLVVWEDSEDDGSKRVEAVNVDINPYRYERGGGYSWTKIPGVHFMESWLTYYPQMVRQEDLEDLC